MNKRRELDEATLAEERKRVAIRDAESEWMSQGGGGWSSGDEKRPAPAHTSTMIISSSSSSSLMSAAANNVTLDESMLTNKSRPSSASVPKAPIAVSTTKKMVSLNAGANILEDNNVLAFYGVKALDVLDIKLDPGIVNQVHVLSFNFIDCDEIVRVLGRAKTKFPNTVVRNSQLGSRSGRSFTLFLKGLIFTCCNIRTFNQLDALADFKKLDSITINKKDNPVTDISFWRHYLLSRLSGLQLKKINDQSVSSEEITTAEKLFSPVRNLSLCLPDYRLTAVLGTEK